MYLLKITFFLNFFVYSFCQFSFLNFPPKPPQRNGVSRINTPNTILRIQVGPKVKIINESISNLSNESQNNHQPNNLNSSADASSLANFLESSNNPSSDDGLVVSNKFSKPAEIRSLTLNELKKLNVKNTTSDLSELKEQPSTGSTESNVSNYLNSSNMLNSPDALNETPKRTNVPSFGFSQPFQNTFGNNLGKPKFSSFGDNSNPTLPFGDNIKPPDISDFNKFTNETANQFKKLPIVSDVLNIPNYFKVNNLKAAIDYMIKYGHLESPIDITKPEELFNLKDAFKKFQEFFGLEKTGLFDQKTLEIMNAKRCGLPDKRTKLTKLFNRNMNLNGLMSGGGRNLIRKKRYQLYSAKYETRNLTWSVSQFSKKALKNLDEQVLEVIRKAFELWKKETNLEFEFKPAEKTDIVIGFYSKVHGNEIEPPFDGTNGTLAHTSYPLDSDLHYDDDEEWSLYPTDGRTDLFTVSIHEIGHKLGLEHSRIKTACLFPIYNPKSTKLDSDDVQGIQSLYGVKHDARKPDKEIIDNVAIEVPDKEKHHDENDEVSDDSEGDNSENNQPDNQPIEEKKPIKILEFNPKKNIKSKKELDEFMSTPCTKLKIDSSVCLLNNKCLVISGDYHFWMKGSLKLIKRKKERNDELFKDLKGKIDSIYRDNDLIHIIQGRNITTYDQFYSKPVNKTTLDQHFPPGLPKHVKNVHSVFKKLSTGVIYIYSGELYWRYTKKNGLEPLPRLTFIWGIPGNIKSVLHFNNGRSVYIRDERYWVFDEYSNRLLSLLPGNISDFKICKNENFRSIFS